MRCGAVTVLFLLLALSPSVESWDAENDALDVYFFFTGDDKISSPENIIGCPTLRCREIVELEYRGWDDTCGGDVESCEWNVLDLVFTVSQGGKRIELTDIQDIPDNQKNAILNAASDGADVLVEISKLADGSGYTVNCRNAFLNGTACSMSDVVEAQRRFLRSDILFVCISGAITLSYLVNYYSIYFLVYQAKKASPLNAYQMALLALSLLANLGIATAKLFWWDLSYNCNTRMCQKMVHNGVMTIVECVFDFALLYCAAKVGVAMSDFTACCEACIKLDLVAHFFNHLFRIIGPLVTIAWLLWDTFQARLYAPGNNSLALVAVAFVLQSLVFLSGIWFFYRQFFTKLCCPASAEDKDSDARGDVVMDVGGAAGRQEGAAGAGDQQPIVAASPPPSADVQVDAQALANNNRQSSGPGANNRQSSGLGLNQIVPVQGGAQPNMGQHQPNMGQIYPNMGQPPPPPPPNMGQPQPDMGQPQSPPNNMGQPQPNMGYPQPNMGQPPPPPPPNMGQPQPNMGQHPPPVGPDGRPMSGIAV